MDIEQRLSEAHTPRPDLDSTDALSRVRTVHRRRRRAYLGAGVVSAAAIVATIGFGLDSTNDQSTKVASGEAGPSADAAPLVPQGWSEMAESPLSARIQSAAVATDEEFVIWGGRGRAPYSDGAAYHFETDEWRSMSPSPLPAQADAAAVWTGTEVVIWGGIGSSGSTDDGVTAAAWNPDTDQWRVIPDDLGLGASKSLTGTAWSGSELILAGVSGPANANLTTDVFAVDPTSGERRSIEPTPRPTAPNYRPRGRAAFAAGDEMLLVTIADGFPVTIDRLDIEAGTWADTVETDLPGLNVSPDAAAWTGSQLVIVNHLGAGVVFDPSDGTLGEIASSDSIDRFAAVAANSNVVSVGDRYLDIQAREWNDAEPVPGPVREFPVTVGFAGAMYLWGGDACGPAASCTDIVDPGPGLIWGTSSRAHENRDNAESPTPPDQTSDSDADTEAVDGPHVGREQESAKDLAERFMAEVLDDPSVAMSATDTDRSTTVVRLETSTGTIVDATVIADPQRQRNVLLELRSPELSYMQQNRTITIPEAGNLTVIGYDGGFTNSGEVMVAALPVSQAGDVGPLDLVESSWLRIDLQTTDGRILHLLLSRG